MTNSNIQGIPADPRLSRYNPLPRINRDPMSDFRPRQLSKFDAMRDLTRVAVVNW